MMSSKISHVILYKARIFRKIARNLHVLPEYRTRDSVKNIEAISKTFSAYFPTFVERILDDPVFANGSSLDRERLQEMLEYNLPYGYRRTPYITLSAYHTMEKPENVTDEQLDLVQLVAWCIHMTQWSYQMMDDITDESDTRDNKPCWYKRKGVGLTAINDGMILSFTVPSLLRRYLPDHKHNLHMVELFNRVGQMTMFGQRLDCTVRPWQEMTTERWRRIVYCKTVWHQSIFPFKMALYLTNTYESEKFKRIQPILEDFGFLFQMMNDISDGFPDRGHPGVNSTDIQEGKCSWLLVQALKLSKPDHMRVIQENYGKKDEEAVKNVLDIYTDLGLKEYAKKSKDELLRNIIEKIEDLPPDYPKQALKNGLMIGFQGY